MIKRIREWIPVEITSGSSLLVLLLVISSVSCSAVHYASDGDEFSSIMEEERGLERIMDRNEAYRIRERMLHNFTRELGINIAASEEADSSEQILRRMLKMDLKNPNTKANMELLRSRILQTQGPMHSRSADLMIDRRRWFFGDHKKCYSGKCEFFLLCWLSGGLVESGCGGFMFACCVRPRSGGHLQAATAYSDSGEYSLQKAYGPVINDPVCGQPNAQTANRRIVGGEESGFGSFPWQAYIRIGTSRCGGSLVNHHYVITAGHCVARSTPDKIRITLGEYTLNSDVEPFPSVVVGVSQINVHPNFKFTPQADRYDVAVLRLSRPVPYQPHISPICLPDKGDDFDGDYAWAAGWGAMQAGSKIRPKTLQAVDVPIIDNTQCERWHKSKGINVVIHEEMVCAGYRYGGKDSCQGDSGGPLMLEDGGRWTLVGIVSAGFSCAQAGQPGIYHRVSATTDWISSVAWS